MRKNVCTGPRFTGDHPNRGRSWSGVLGTLAGMSEQRGEWSPPDPRGLPGLRDELIEHLRSAAAHDQTAQTLLGGLGTLSPQTGDPARDAAGLLADERSRLANAELYFVTEDMTRLAAAAAESLPVHTFHPEDLPAEAGFMVFAEPVGRYVPTKVPNVQDTHVQVVAVSWGPSQLMQTGAGVWMTFWSFTDTEGTARMLQHTAGWSYSRAYEHVRQNTATLTWDNEVLMRYGSDRIAIATEDSSYNELRGTTARIDPEQGWEQVRGTTAEWSQITRAAWLLITQPGVTDVDDLAQSRAMRRRAERSGYKASPVRVVRVRDHANTPERAGNAEERTYHVRWTVRGHWRNQWYPSRGEHRPVWINPHIKGPRDAPLQSGETVHLLDQ